MAKFRVSGETRITIRRRVWKLESATNPGRGGNARNVNKGHAKSSNVRVLSNVLLQDVMKPKSEKNYSHIKLKDTSGSAVLNLYVVFLCLPMTSYSLAQCHCRDDERSFSPKEITGICVNGIPSTAHFMLTCEYYVAVRCRDIVPQTGLVEL